MWVQGEGGSVRVQGQGRKGGGGRRVLGEAGLQGASEAAEAGQQPGNSTAFAQAAPEEGHGDSARELGTQQQEASGSQEQPGAPQDGQSGGQSGTQQEGASVSQEQSGAQQDGASAVQERSGTQQDGAAAPQEPQGMQQESQNRGPWLCPEDENLFTRAVATPPNGAPRIAFLFLVRGPLPLAPLWARFFEGPEDRFSIYIHTAVGFKYNDSDIPPVFRGRQVPSQVSQVDQLASLAATRAPGTAVPSYFICCEHCLRPTDVRVLPCTGFS